MIYTTMESPVGTLTLAGQGHTLHFLLFPDNRHEPQSRADWTFESDAFGEARRQLGEYFAGSREVFELDLAPAGTPFQMAVWRLLSTIPYGKTWSYRQLAEAVGNEKAVRAVGLANGRNPLPVIVPCHRVIGSNGSLTGFGGGLDAKRTLLELEARTQQS